MMDLNFEMIGITVLWTFLYGYVIVASIDFGAGFFNYYAMETGQHKKVSHIIQRYLSPVWETTNVFFVFFFVGIVVFYADTAYYLGTTMFIRWRMALALLSQVMRINECILRVLLRRHRRVLSRYGILSRNEPAHSWEYRFNITVDPRKLLRIQLECDSAA